MKLFVLKSKLIMSLLTFVILTASTQAKVVSFTKDTDGITCTLDKGLMKVKICLDNIVEVKYTSLPLFLDKPSLVITNEWKITPVFSVNENANEIIITTASLKVIVNRQNNSVRYTDLNGKIILSEDELQGKTMTSATIAGIPTYNCTSQFISPADEALYGLGCHPEDSLSINYKGRNQDMAIKYMTGAIPVLLIDQRLRTFMGQLLGFQFFWC